MLWCRKLPDWDDIFTEKGHVFSEPHRDMNRIADIFIENDVHRILDLGCGTGRHLVFFSKRGFDVFGFDSSLRAISLAKQWLSEENLEADVQQHRMELPFPFDDEFFDGIISIQVVHHNLLSDIKATINEMTRVLRPRGLTFVTFPILYDGPVAKEDDWDFKKIEEGTFIPQGGPESGIPHHFFTTNEIPRIFRQFELLEIYIDNTRHRCILGRKK